MTTKIKCDPSAFVTRSMKGRPRDEAAYKEAVKRAVEEFERREEVIDENWYVETKS